MGRKGLFILALATVGVVVLANAARQAVIQQPLLQNTTVKIEQLFTLTGPSSGDLVVLAETINLEADSRVQGNVALIGDVVQVQGDIDGDLTIVSDETLIGPGARITGNATLLMTSAHVEGQVDGTLHVMGEDLTISPDAAVTGTVYSCAENLTDRRSDAPLVHSCEESDLWSSTGTLAAVSDPGFVLPLLNVTISGAVLAVLFTAAASLALSGLSILAVVLFPRQISHIEEAVRTGPRSLGGTGLMLMLLAGGVTATVIMIVVVVPPAGLVVVPVYAVAALVFFGMVLAGWVTMTLVTGDLILQRLNRGNLPPLVIAAVGNVSLLLGWNVLALHHLTATFGLVALAMLAAVGLGATYLTRLGTRPIHRSYLVQG